VKLYVVTMYRNGDNNKRSYIMGVYDNPDIARRIAEAEEEYRDGKYAGEVLVTDLNFTLHK
jgi:hypothetical protein